MQGIRITPHPILMRFNSHTYMYDTSQCECEKPLLQLVSIHAPAWGATRAENLPKIRDWFQFTRPRGARRIPTSVSSMVGCFNSRARVGRDQAMPRQASRAECFNSRARVGRDIIVVDGIIFPVVSIHAPAWGATAISSVERI